MMSSCDQNSDFRTWLRHPSLLLILRLAGSILGRNTTITDESEARGTDVMDMAPIQEPSLGLLMRAAIASIHEEALLIEPMMEVF